MSNIIKSLPMEVKPRPMDTLAFKEFMLSGGFREAMLLPICYMESERGGYVFISRTLATACFNFYESMRAHAKMHNYVLETALKTAGLMLWGQAGISQTKRNLSYHYEPYPAIDQKITVECTEP